MKRYVLRFFCVVMVFTISVASWSGLASDQQPALSSAPDTKADQFERLRRQAFDAFYNLDYGTSEKLFKEMTESLPDHPAGYLYLATQVWVGQLNQTRRLQTSVYSNASFYSKTPDKVDPDVDRQIRSYVQKSIEKAQARLQQDPRDIEARYFLGAAYGVLAGYQGSVTREFFAALKDGSRAVAEHRKVVEQDPHFVDAYLSIGMYDYIVGSLPLWVKMLATLGGVRGGKERGIEQLRRAAEKGKYTSDDAGVLLIAIYAREGQDHKALDMVNLLAHRYPRNYYFSIEAANIMVKMGRKQEGFNAFDAMLQRERFRDVCDMIHFQYAETLSVNGYHTAALHHYRSVTTMSPASPQLMALSHLRIGQVLDVQGHREAAIAAYQTVLNQDNVFDSHELAQRYLNKPFTGSGE